MDFIECIFINHDHQVSPNMSVCSTFARKSSELIDHNAKLLPSNRSAVNHLLASRIELNSYILIKYSIHFEGNCIYGR